MKLVESVPNFSEGRRRNVIEEIANAARSVKGVTVLDCENDENHNRMVLTLVGSPSSVKDGVLAACEVALREIDLTRHKGEHPRMGAVDVVPFVPLGETTMEECVDLANQFAREYSEKFRVPVFLYEEAATRPERRDLANVREGQFEGLAKLIGKEPSKDPDFGPKAIHPTAGATAVGARRILIAFNVNLRTSDLSIAKKIARQVRGRDGGLAFVKALGFELKDRGMVQVSMNLTDYKRSSMYKAFDLISDLANRYGVSIAESEIVGLVPMDALIETSEYYLKLANFKADQIIENRLFALSSGEQGERYNNLTISSFASSISSVDPVPGGGSVSAYAGVLAASLVAMVCRLTIGKKGYEKSNEKASAILSSSLELASKLQDLVNEDANAFNLVADAMKMPRGTDEERRQRSEKLSASFKRATEVPLATMRNSLEVLKLAKEILEIGNKNARSDAETAIEMARASILGAWSNVKINLESLSGKDPAYVSEIKKELEPIVKDVSLI